ncbi:MAG: hypothetical protein U9R66_11745 [Thermodesulfobacteriota bacterium]|nr:hypothetical protein [Thermodesulfobacteriota bacterium]
MDFIPEATLSSQRPSKKRGNLITCPNCGNDRDFFEIAEGVILTTHYVQNADSSFTQDSDESQILGQIRFFCGECNTDLSQFHQRFVEMLF